MDCRRAKEDEDEEEEDGEMRVCSATVKIWIGFLYFGNSLRSIKTGLGWFFKPKESFEDGFWRAFY